MTTTRKPSKPTRPEKASGLNWRTDHLRRVRWSRKPSILDRSARFEQFQSDLMTQAISFQSAEAEAAAHLIAFNAVIVESILPIALAAMAHPYRVDGYVAIEWTPAHGRLDRRYLAPMTTRLLPKLDASALPLALWRQHLASALGDTYANENALEELLHDAAVWHAENLNGPLLAHIARLAPMTALPQSALARKEQKLALLVSDPPSAAGLNIAFGIALEGYLEEEKDGPSESVIHSLTDACSTSEGPNGVQKNRMLKRIFSLVPAARRAGSSASIIAAFHINLVESGTQGEPDLAASTVQKYVRAGAIGLYRAINGLHLEGMEANKRKDLYLKVRGAASASAQAHAAAYLAAFDSFLVEWLDIDPVAGSMYEGIPDTPPRANIIWPHERKLVFEWAANPELDHRLSNNWLCTWHISEAGRIRAWELFHLSLRNIKINPDSVEVEIAPLPRHGRVKSPSARRTIIVKSQPAITALANLVDKRRKEGAADQELLLGNPHKKNCIYRFGVFYLGLNRMLKAATGERTVSFHTLSHTNISLDADAALQTTTTAEINPFDQIAVDAAHRSYSTSQTYYAHLFELALRKQLDAALTRSPLASHVAALWCDTSATKLRKDAVKSKLSSREHSWRVVLTMPSLDHIPMAADGFVFRNPTPPDLPGLTSAADFERILAILVDLSSSMTVEVTALRSDCEPAWIEQVACACHSTLINLRGYLPPQGVKPAAFEAPSLPDALAALQSLNADARCGIDFTRVEQPKFEAIRAWLAGADTTSLARAGSNWTRTYCGGIMSLDDPLDAEELIAFLSKAGVSPALLGIAISESDQLWSVANQGNAIQRIDGVFLRRFSVTPARFSVKRRRARPRAYLILSSCAVLNGQQPPTAAVSSAGLNALLLSAEVTAIIRTRSNCPRGEPHG